MVDREVDRVMESIRSSIRKRLYSVYIVFGIVVSLLDNFIGLLIESETYGLLKGVDRAARPF